MPETTGSLTLTITEAALASAYVANEVYGVLASAEGQLTSITQSSRIHLIAEGESVYVKEISDLCELVASTRAMFDWLCNAAGVMMTQDNLNILV